MIETKRPRGRPRSERCRIAVNDAMKDLLDELPYQEITVETVAARAGVSKQTIYRWWSGKHELAMVAYAEKTRASIPTPDLGSLRADLHAILERTCIVLDDRRGGTTVAGLIAAAQSDDVLARDFRETFIGSRRAIMRGILERGIARGELRAGIDLPFAIDLLYGPIWYRLLLQNAPLDASFGRAIADSFLASFSK